MVLLTSLSSYAQNTSMVGDGFGGRAGYCPSNIGLGVNQAYAVCGSNNQLYGWGTDQFYCFGVPSNIDPVNGAVNGYSTPVAIPGMTNVIQFAGGSELNGAIKSDGTGWVWGSQGTDPRVINFPTPTQVITDAYQCEGTANSGCFLFVKKDGTVWIIGSFPPFLLMSDACKGPSPCALQLQGITNAKRVTIGSDFILILLADGTVQYLGRFLNVSVTTPTTIPGLSNIVAIEAHNTRGLFLNSAGQVFTALNTDTTPVSLVPFPSTAAPIKAIAMTAQAGMMALDDNSNFYVWGSELGGQLGGGLANNNSTFIPSPVLRATNVRDMKGGQSFSYIIKNDGTLWGTGSTSWGATYPNYLFLNKGSQKTTSYTQLDPVGSGLCAIPTACFTGMAPCVAGTTAPALTPTTATNSCPTATVNLASLPISSTTPSGASLIWSTHKTPTSAGDTLTTAQKTAVSTAGKYYAMYYDAANACYSPADSVEVTITTCTVNLANACPTATVNLMTAISATNLPSGATVTWHTGTPATTANKVSDPTAVSTSGNYYMAYFDGTNNCYSETAGPVIVTITVCVPDTDGDNITDDTDLDDDNDGILDTVEQAACSPSSLTCDSDGDGIINSLDLDSDNDGINDVIEAGGTDADKNGVADGTVSATGIPATANTGLTAPDTDGDGKKNPYDLDSDNDGINDLVESGNALLADANGDGMVDGTDTDKDGILGAADGTPSTWADANDTAPVDTDGTGGANYIDTDADGDGLTDLAESGITNPAALDANGDGKIDDATDTDGDGIPQGVDGAPTAFGDANSPALPDTDGDGKPDYIDAADTDGDGVADATDLDDDNDGILDTVEQAACSPSSLTCDTDGDGIINSLDLDSDNDGINDVIEAGGTDADKNGVADGTVSATGIPATANTGLTAPDTDGDGKKNPYDLDSDNDGINDLVESGNALLADANGDGMVDGTDTDKDGILGAADGTPSTWADANDTAPVDTDGTGGANYIDTDADGDGLTDLAESGITNPAALDANGDGKIDDATDTDGDGIPQGVDGAPTAFGDANSPALPDTDGDGKPDYIDAADTDGDGVADATDLDDDNDGIPDATEGTADTDGDGVKDALDLDSDNDGINDVIEAGGTDANGDGKQDGTPNATTGQIGTGLTPPNSDNDTVPDYKDLDSDNDGVSDLQEGGSGGTDANNDGVVDGPDTDGDGIPNSVDGLAGFGDASSPALPNGDSDTLPDYRDVDSDGDGINDIVEKAAKGSLDGNNDGMVDNPTDPDGDGIANNSGLDTIPAGFGGLPTANAPFDLMPNFTFGGTSYTVNATKTVVINVNEIKGVATSGTIEVFVPFSSGFTFSFNATQSSATVVSAETVNNADWVMTTTATGLKFTAKSGVTIPANGRSRIAITVKADTAGTDASITANVTPLSSEVTAQNNVAVLGISIQN